MVQSKYRLKLPAYPAGPAQCVKLQSSGALTAAGAEAETSQVRHRCHPALKSASLWCASCEHRLFVKVQLPVARRESLVVRCGFRACSRAKAHWARLHSAGFCLSPYSHAMSMQLPGAVHMVQNGTEYVCLLCRSEHRQQTRHWTRHLWRAILSSRQASCHPEPLVVRILIKLDRRRVCAECPSCSYKILRYV